MVSKINLPNRLKMLDRINQLSIIHCEPCVEPGKYDMAPCKTCPVFQQIRTCAKSAGYVDKSNKQTAALGDFNAGAWSIEEEDYLTQSYKKVPIDEISKKLNRTKQAIRQKARKMRELAK